MNARDELAGLLFTTDNSKSVEPWSEWEHCKNEPRLVEYVYAMADEILAAGYSKPRTITTAEELDALPVGSVVRSTNGTWQKDPDDDGISPWVAPGVQRLYAVRWIMLPATVLYEPQP